MKNSLFSCFLIAALLSFRAVAAQGNAAPAVAFYQSLNVEQQQKITYPFDDASKTAWHYFPSTMWPRSGLALAALDESQKALLFEALKSSTGKSGYEKARAIIELERFLFEGSGRSATRDPENYYVAFYGDPEADAIWAWSFEGHHLSLNFTARGDAISMAPRFFGANPATIPSGPRKGERALAREQDLGLRLIQSMSAAQIEEAVIAAEAFRDITTGNAQKVDRLEPAGIRRADLSTDQRKILDALIAEYLSAMPEDLAAKRMEQLNAEEMDDVRFAWAGATEPGRGHYYRVQGKSFLIEFDNTQNGANHIHSVWRDFDGDFGRDLTREHRRASHTH